jgi:monofunctional biosynthetic peptidoglycan transglycosylase
MRLLLDFEDPAEVELFAAVDDAVMGGLSSSRLIAVRPGIAAFEGFVSLANRGGFASVRSRPRRWHAAGADAFVLRLRGDGKRYRFNVRTAGGPDAFRYEAALDLAPGEWTEVEVPIGALRAKVFGQAVPGAGRPDPARIERIGFMISDRQAGPFRLEIDWIAASMPGP